MADEPHTDPTPDAQTDTPADQPIEPQAESQPDDQAGAEDKPDQKVTIEELSPTSKKLLIEVPAEHIREKIDSSFSDLQDEAAIPGFRRGRAPLRLLEKRFGSDIRKEVKNQLLAESLSAAVEANDLRIIGEPDMADPDDIELPEQGPMTFQVTIEVVPPVTLPNLEGLKLKRVVRPIDAEAIQAEIERLSEIYGQFKVVEEPVAGGDYLTVDLHVRNAEGETLDEQHSVQILCPGESRNYKGVVAGMLVDDLGKQLEGTKVGQSVIVHTTGPDQHENQAMRGVELDIEITPHRIERLHRLSLEELIQAGGFDDEADLREQLKDSMEQRQEAQQQRELHEQVIEILVNTIDVDLPEKLSAQQAQRILHHRRVELMYQGLGEQDIEQRLAEMRATSDEQARRELKLLFILEKVAEQYDVQVTEAEINGRIASMASQQGRRPEKLRQEMSRSGQLDQLFIQLRESKAIDKLIETAEIEEVTEAADDDTEAPAADAPDKAPATDDESVADDQPAAAETDKKKTTSRKTTTKKTSSKSPPKKK